MSNLKIVRGDDWEALYKDNELIGEGHSVTEQALDEAGVQNFYLTDAATDKMFQDGSYFPKSFWDLAGDIDDPQTT